MQRHGKGAALATAAAWPLTTAALGATWWLAIATAGAVALIAAAALAWNLRLRRSVAARTRELRGSRRRYRVLTENTSDLILEATPDGRFAYASPRFHDLLGYAPADLLGKPILEFVFPDDRASATRALTQAFGGEQQGRATYRAVRRDGGVIWLATEGDLYRDESGAIRVVIVCRDVTEPLRAEAEIREQRQILDTTLRLVPDAIVYQRDGAVVYANPAFRQLWGFEPALHDAGATNSDAERIARQMEEPERFMALVAETVASGGMRHAQFRTRDGRTIDLTFHQYATDDGHTGGAATFRDVTEQRQAEADLRESQRFLASLIANASGFFYRSHNTHDWPLEYASAGIERFTGYSAEDFVEGRVAFGQRIHPDDADAVWESVQRAVAAREPFEVTYRFARRDGTEAWLWEHGHGVYDGERQLVALEGFITDITQRKRAEDAARLADELRDLVLASTTNAIAADDPEGTMVLVNDRACEISGYARKELLGQHFTMLYPAEAHDGLRAGFERLLSGGTMPAAEMEWLRKDGTRVTVSIEGRPMRRDGRIIGVVATAEDVTERKRLEQQFLQAQKMEVVGRLAGGVAHDVNNLMTAIIGYADLARDAVPADSEVHRDIVEIGDTAARAGNLADQLLTFSRRQIVSPEVIDLNERIAGAERMLGRLLGPEIEIVTSGGTGLWPVRIDPVQLDQVIVNLAVNARDAMPAGGTLTFATSNATSEGGDMPGGSTMPPGRYALMTVADTGSGMSEEVRRHAFEPFYTTKGAGQGTGLGLATCYGIVKQAGGEIAVESEAGRGSTFAVYLPAVEPQAREIDGAPEVAMPRGSETILLVDDEDAVRRTTERSLRALGYRVLSAPDGATAARLLSDAGEPIDLLVSDVVMPDVNGRELASRLLRARPNLRVLLMSGYADDEGIQQAVDDHAFAYLQKPFNMARLALRVREVLDPPAGVNDR